MKKVIILYQDDYPWDVRIEKFIKTFVNKYEVHLLCRNKGLNKELEKINERFFIHRIPKKLSKNKILTEPFHLNIIWKLYLERKVKEINPNLIVVRNLPLAKLGIKCGKKFNIPVIFDNAENYPEFIRFFSKYNRFPFIQLDKLGYFEKLEKYCVENSNVTINVIEENTDRLKKNNVGGNIIHVYNTPYLVKNAIESIDEDRKTYKLCYIGALDDDGLRGTSDIIKCMKYMDEKYKLYIIGDGPEKNALKILANEINVADKVEFLGRINYSEITKIAQKFDIGVVSHRKNNMTDTTMANKIYEYMSLGLCVISTNAIPLEKFTVENNIGLVYKSGDSEDLAEKIRLAVKKGYLSNNQRKKRIELYETIYNWSHDSRKLMNEIDKIIN